MRSAVLLFFTAIILVSCAAPMQTISYTSYEATPVIEIVSVERTIRKDNTIESRLTTIYEGKLYSEIIDGEFIYLSSLSYSDKNLRIFSRLGEKGVYYSIDNRSLSTISLDWNRAAFVTENGVSGRLLPENTRFIDIRKTIMPSIIIAGATFSINVVPESNVYYFDGSAYNLPGLSGWQVKDMYKTKTSENETELETFNVGNTYKALVPFEIDDKSYEYLFTYKIVKNEIKSEIKTKKVPISP